MPIHVILNGERRLISGDSITVAALIAELGKDSRRVAVERNGGIVPKALHESTWLQEGDAVEIVAFIGGG